MNAESTDNREPLCLRGGHVLTFDDDDTVFEDGEVWIEDGAITAVGPAGATAPPRWPERRLSFSIGDGPNVSG